MIRPRQTYSTISDLKKDFSLFSPIYSLLSKTFTHLTKPKLKNLSALILTFFQHTSFALYNIAQAFPAHTTQKHKHKALLRALKNISLDEPFYTSYLKVLFALPGMRLLRRYTLPLLIDVTTLKDDYWILAAGIPVHGRAIPAYLKVWSGVNVSYDFWARVESFLRELWALLPEDWRYIVVADRGFRGPVLPKVCEALGLGYIIRIHEDFWVRLEGSKEWRLVSSLRPGKYKCAEIGKESRMRGHVVVHEWADKKGGGVERWYLQTNLGDTKGFIVGMYAKRMQIEEGFRDLKRVMRSEEYTGRFRRGNIWRSV